MKLSEKLIVLEQQDRQETIRRENRKLLKDLISFTKPTEAEKEALENFYNLITERLWKICVGSFQRVSDEIKFAKKHYGEVRENKIFGVLLEGKPFPILLVYLPWLEEKTAREEEEEKRKRNYALLKQKMQEKGLHEPEGFEDFVVQKLPLVIDGTIAFDGSIARAKKILTSQKEVNLFGSMEAPIFAMQYQWEETEKRFTIFMPAAIDYRASLAVALKWEMNLSFELSAKISASLPHDVYYIVKLQNRYHELMKFSDAVLMAMQTEMGVPSFLLVGTHLYDVLNGQTLVFSHNGKKYLDLDDEKPSAFVINRRLYVYAPTT